MLLVTRRVVARTGKVPDFTLRVSHTFMDVGRKHETPESETENFMAHSTSSSQVSAFSCAGPLSLNSYTVMMQRSRCICTRSGLAKQADKFDE